VAVLGQQDDGSRSFTMDDLDTMTDEELKAIYRKVASIGLKRQLMANGDTGPTGGSTRVGGDAVIGTDADIVIFWESMLQTGEKRTRLSSTIPGTSKGECTVIDAYTLITQSRKHYNIDPKSDGKTWTGKKITGNGYSFGKEPLLFAYKQKELFWTTSLEDAGLLKPGLSEEERTIMMTYSHAAMYDETMRDKNTFTVKRIEDDENYKVSLRRSELLDGEWTLNYKMEGGELKSRQVLTDKKWRITGINTVQMELKQESGLSESKTFTLQSKQFVDWIADQLTTKAGGFEIYGRSEQEMRDLEKNPRYKKDEAGFSVPV